MKNKKLLILIPVILIACAAVILSSFVSEENANDQAIIEELKDVIAEEYSIIFKADNYPITADKYLLKDYTSEEISAFSNEFKEKLATVYSAKCIGLTQYSKVRDNVLGDDQTNFSMVLENGIFNITVNNSEISDTNATIDVTIDSWQKYMTKNEDGSFRINFPTSTSSIKYNFEIEDGKWKIVSREMYDHLFGADEEQAKVFDDLGDLLEYSSEVSVNNVK